MVSSLATRGYSPQSMMASYPPPYASRAERREKSSLPSFEQTCEQALEQIYDLLEEHTSFLTAHELQKIGRALQSKATFKKLKPDGPRRCQAIKKTDKKTGGTKPPSPARVAIVEMIQRVERRAAAQNSTKQLPAKALLTQPDLPDYEEDEGDEASGDILTPPATPELNKNPDREGTLSVPVPSEPADAKPQVDGLKEDTLQISVIDAVPVHNPESECASASEHKPESEPVPTLELEAESESEPEMMHWDAETEQDVTADILLAIVISGMESLSIEPEKDTRETNQLHSYGMATMPAYTMDLDDDRGLVQAAGIDVSLVDGVATASAGFTHRPPAMDDDMHVDSSTGAADLSTQCSAPMTRQAAREPSFGYPAVSAAICVPTHSSESQASKSATSGRPSSVRLSLAGPSTCRRRERACPLLPSTTRRESFAKKVFAPPTKNRQPLPWSTPGQVPLPCVTRAPLVLPRPKNEQPFLSMAPPRSHPLDPISALVEAMSQLKLGMSTATSCVGRTMNRWKQFLPAIH